MKQLIVVTIVDGRRSVETRFEGQAETTSGVKHNDKKLKRGSDEGTRQNATEGAWCRRPASVVTRESVCERGREGKGERGS
jgi:hypothetical protein